MTTLAAIELQDGSILIGSDSMAANVHSLSEGLGQYDPVEKWVQWPDGWFIGLAGFVAIYQDLQDQAPKIELDETVASVRAALKKMFAAYGEPEYHKGVPNYEHSAPLAVRVGTGVYTICNLLSAIKIRRGALVAEGSGRDFVYGAFEATGGNREGMAPLEIQQRLTEAMEAAIMLDDRSGPPVKIEKLELPQRTIKPVHDGVRTGITVAEFDEAVKASSG